MPLELGNVVVTQALPESVAPRAEASKGNEWVTDEMVRLYVPLDLAFARRKSGRNEKAAGLQGKIGGEVRDEVKPGAQRQGTVVVAKGRGSM